MDQVSEAIFSLVCFRGIWLKCLLQQNPNQVSLLDIAKKLETRFLLQNVEEAKKLVDAAYEYTQNR